MRALWHRLDLVSVPLLALETGARPGRRFAGHVEVGAARRPGAGSRTLVHRCGYPCGYPPIGWKHGGERSRPQRGHAMRPWRGMGAEQVSEHRVNLGVVWEQVVRE